jgi:hypothetical protein
VNAPKALALGMTVTDEIARRYNEMAELLDRPAEPLGDDEANVTWLGLGEGIRSVEEAIDAACQEGRVTWLTDNGKRVAAIVPVDRLLDLGPSGAEPAEERRILLAEDRAREIARALTVALDALDLSNVERMEANQAIARALHAAAG